MTDWRAVKPPRLPRCCNCGQGVLSHHQLVDGAFVCDVCGGYLGYCGPNGCDTGLPHRCWVPHPAVVPEIPGATE
jgi:hypothetical protein